MSSVRVGFIVLFGVVACAHRDPPPVFPDGDGGVHPPSQDHPKEGESCDLHPRDAYCVDDATLLACAGGRFVKQACRECRQVTHGDLVETVRVDCHALGVGAEGASCNGDSRDCDGTDLVVCDAGKFRRYPCSGPDGCSFDHGARCDTRQAAVGASCRGDSNACSRDGKTMLQCKDGRFAERLPCGGPKGCTFDRNDVECDLSQAAVGDPCEAGSASCTRDGKTWLSCDGGRFAVVMQCAGPDAKCTTEGGAARCNHPKLGTLGTPCGVQDFTVCSADRMSKLRCNHGVFVLDQKCPKGCEGEALPGCK
jgi:hypothetical protein